MHYSFAELAAMQAQTASGSPGSEHLNDCEQCHYLWTIVRRSRGEPSDEELEVTVDALKTWANPAAG